MLAARSERAARFESYSSLPVLLLKANMPGEAKNDALSSFLLNLFSGYITQLLPIKHSSFHASADGDYILYAVNGDPGDMKRIAVFLETHHALGAYVDIDCFASGRITRSTLGFSPRRCWVCHDDARVCARTGRHRLAQLLEKRRGDIERYTSSALAREAVQALRKEVFMYPSFALVSPKDTGRHADMNLSHFLSAFEVLAPFFSAYADASLHVLRKIGRRGEAALQRDVAVNTHKGANYIFGLMLPFYKRALLRGHAFNDMLEAIMQTARGYMRSDFDTSGEPSTRGERLYRKEGVKGIRGEAAEGFPSIFSWYPHRASKLKKLVAIAARAEDTTLHGRSYSLQAIRRSLREAEEDSGTLDAVQADLKRQGVSPGGAADLLAVTFFLESTDHLFKGGRP